MSAQLGSLVVSLEANIARFTADMNRASEATENAMARMQAGADKIKNALGFIGVALTFDALVGEVNRAIDGMARLDDMIQKTGASAETLSKLGKVAAFTGTDIGAVDGMIVKLAKNMATADEKGSKFAKAMGALGLSIDGIENRDPAQQFVDIANALQDYEDGAGKAAIMTDLINKSAAEMLPYLNDVAESLNDFTGETAEAAAAAAKYQDDLGRMKVKYDEVATSIVKAALPAMTDFVGGISDGIKESSALTGISVDTWADDVAVGLARVVDVAALLPRILSTIGSSFKAVGADIEFLVTAAATATPQGIGRSLAQGINPIETIRKAFDERNAVVDEANKKLDDLWTKPANVYEQAVLKRITARRELEATAGADAMAGMLPGTGGAKPAGKKPLNYGGDQPTSTARKSAATRVAERGDDETFALRNAIELTAELEQAEARRMTQKTRDIQQSGVNAESIRQSLMTELESEQFAFDSRIEKLRSFGAMKIENEFQANSLIEAETARHQAVLNEMDRQRAEQKAMNDMQMLQQAGGVADQMYSMLQKAGLEQSALGKAAFLASKGLAVAQIIMSTNAAAAAAVAPVAMGGLGPVAGLGLAGTIKAMGYASAAMTAGLAIAEASAEGGYDIPAGVNPVTQLHEKEMVLPKAQAEVIRGLATRGRASGEGIIVNYSPNIHIDGDTDMEKNRKMIAMVVAQGNADLVDRLQRAGHI